jgi:hypothetical protein
MVATARTLSGISLRAAFDQHADPAARLELERAQLHRDKIGDRVFIWSPSRNSIRPDDPEKHRRFQLAGGEARTAEALAVRSFERWLARGDRLVFFQAPEQGWIPPSDWKNRTAMIRGLADGHILWRGEDRYGAQVTTRRMPFPDGKPTDVDLRQWYDRRVETWPAGIRVPNEDEDLAEAKLRWPGIKRSDIRTMRPTCVPEDWRKRGTRPGSKAG